MSDQLQNAVNSYMITVGNNNIKDTAKKHEIKLIDGQAMAVSKSKETLRVVLPEKMNKLQAAFNLLHQFSEEETARTYNREYKNFFINDFMVTIGALIPRYFGMLHVSPVDTAGFPAGKNYIQFPIGYGEDGSTKTASGYIGSIYAPVWENAILDIFPGMIKVKAKLKFEEEVEEFLADVEYSLEANSIIKRSAVEIVLHPMGLMANPIKAKKNDKIVLREDTKRVVDNLLIPSLRDKSKTSILFTGDFGTGKTETAIRMGITGRERYDRTFFYLQNSEMFKPMIPFIKNYQPCLIFCEDVDQISSGDRDSSMNDLLNQLDGNELKNVDCTFIFTTNNHDKIHPAMRRPGRIDQVVHFDYCDKESIAKIFKLHADGIKGWEEVDYQEAASYVPEGLQGAVIAEMSRRAIKYALNLHDGVISTDRFKDACASMKSHIEFMKNDQKKEHTAEELLGHLLFKGMKKAFPAIDTADPADYESPFKESPFVGLQS